jgi:hypothetical protein
LYIRTARTFFNEIKFPLVQFHVTVSIVYIVFGLIILGIRIIVWKEGYSEPSSIALANVEMSAP